MKLFEKGINPLLPFSLKTVAGAHQAMGLLDQKLTQLSSDRGVIGAFQSRLQSATSTLQSGAENFTAAASCIADSDIASESANLLKSQILQKMSSAIIAQANESPALALTLLRT